MRVVFFGTPAFAVPTLERLIAAGHDVAAVVTQPDRPRGRGQQVVAGPVKRRAGEAGLPVLQPHRLRDEGFLDAFRGLQAEAGIVAAYGKILPPVLLEIPRLGFLNVHASLLPRWRGAAPVHRAILAGDQETGVTIMQMVAALDAGPMLAQRAVSIGPQETSQTLEARLATAGADLLIEVLDRLSRGPIAGEPQDDARATYAARLERAESDVDWNQTAQAIHDRIRGLQPWPAAVVRVSGRQLKLLASSVADGVPGARPGTIVRVERDAFTVAASDGAVRVTRVQLEGRPAASVRDFLNGHPLRPGDVLDRAGSE